MKKSLLIGLFLFASFCLADTIILKNGEILKGDIIKQDENQIIIKYVNGVTTLKRAEVKKVFLVTKNKVEENNTSFSEAHKSRYNPEINNNQILTDKENPLNTNSNSFHVYFDIDAGKWGFFVNPSGYTYSTGIQSEQEIGLGLGIDYELSRQNDPVSYVFGAKLQFPRQIKNPINESYNITTAYGQIRHSLSKYLYTGLEVNYSFYNGSTNLLSGTSVSGDFGYGVLLGYIIDDMFINIGYRLINAKATATGVLINMQSNGLFVQTGFIF